MTSKVYRPVIPLRRNNYGKWVEAHDVSTAEEFGELQQAIIPNQQAVNVIGEQWIVERLTEGLAGFSDDDYLLIHGDPEILALAIKIAADENNGRVKFLKWDRREFSYVVRTYNFNERDNEDGR